MSKPIYKYATVWTILGGTALAYIYLKTLGKNKNLSIKKTFLIGGSIGAGLGLGIDLIKSNRDKVITEQELLESSKKIGGDTELELNSFLSASKNSYLSESDNQDFLKVLKAFVKAKNDGKWDSKGNIEDKKKVLISYGAKDYEIKTFEKVLRNNLSNTISEIIAKTANVKDNKYN